MSSPVRALTWVVAFMSSAVIAAGLDWTVSFRSAGPVRVGMSLARVRVALGDPRASLQKAFDSDDCSYLESRNLPKAIGLMFRQDHLLRIDVWSVGVRTTKGISVGDAEGRIKQAYGDRISVTPNFYDVEHGHYVEVAGRGVDGGYALLFETDGQKITAYRTGIPDAVRLVEGCS